MDIEFKNKFIDLIDNENIKTDLKKIEDDQAFLESISIEYRIEFIPLDDTINILIIDSLDKESDIDEEVLSQLSQSYSIKLDDDRLKELIKIYEKLKLVMELSKAATLSADRTIAFACFLLFTDSLAKPPSLITHWANWMKNASEQYKDKKLKYLYGVALNFAKILNISIQDGDPQIIILNAFHQNPSGIIQILISYINIRRKIFTDHPESISINYDILKKLFTNISQESFPKVLMSIDLSTISEYYFSIGDVEGAAELVDSSLDYWPENSHANCLLGLIASSKDDYSESINYFLRAETLAKDQFLGLPTKDLICINIFTGLSYSYYKTGLFENSLNYSDKALKLKPTPLLHAIILNNRGQTWLEKSDIDKANEDFIEALQILTNLDYESKELEGTIRNNKAIIYYRRGLIDKAKSECELAISISPKLAEAYNTLGVIYNEEGNQKIALRLFQTAIKINPSLKRARKNISDLTAEYEVDWYNWWFGPNVSFMRKLTGGALIMIILIDMVSAHWFFYTGKDLANNFMIMVGITIAILLVPYIKKLSVGGVELELESKAQSMPPSLAII